MKKLLAIALLASSSLLALGDQFYIGVGVNNKGSGIRDYYRTSDNAYIDSVEFDESGNYFKIGYMTPGLDRIELIYSEEEFTNIHNSSDSDTETGVVCNSIISITSFSNNLLLPYVSGGVGVYNSKAYDKEGGGLNFGIGIYISFLQNIEIDTSYKINYITTDLKNGSYMEDAFETFNVGVNYKF